jgi:hypothetical protein
LVSKIDSSPAMSSAPISATSSAHFRRKAASSAEKLFSASIALRRIAR